MNERGKTGEARAGQRYQLRHAAGVYWLLDMEQEGRVNQKPQMLNACGAQIWEDYVQGETMDQMAEHLCGEYGITKEQAENDVRSFVEQLKTQGVM